MHYSYKNLKEMYGVVNRGFDVTAPFEFEKIRGGCFPLNCPLV
ncbi:unnamed protein product [Larinioides sclopetarius]|uniref:Uncharacterized protein n=1 Tax=Larinioides sclopetarius TaxID=280406 RepID=A0AAV1ZN20_9ARAC